ncbi:hypothetical protein HPP92_023419 [Vanilla planifolia]|uniref:Avr9/Cf-9 rapidly elicited protein 146 n=1 Tax=Vanilla planifolia TaxID=51239 RepID=A0A835PYG4_VANPL|nr:hypothetical protein HPP92_023419 [Vanilla planifolia]
MESNAQPTATETATATGKRLWHIVRAVFVMLREGLAKRRLLAELRLHLLLRRGKLAGKAIRGVLSELSHHQHHHTLNLTRRWCRFLSCRFMDPDASVYVPHEVQFSCSNTPFYASSRQRSQRCRRKFGYDAEEIARAFEFLDSVADEESSAEVSPLPSVLATPVVPVKQLRVTDSPFVDEEETEADDAVDRRAEEFIRSFYDRRRQEMIGF